MNKLNKAYVLVASLLALTVLNTADAGDVKILASDFHSSGDNRWSVNVTLEHGDKNGVKPTIDPFNLRKDLRFRNMTEKINKTDRENTRQY